MFDHDEAARASCVRSNSAGIVFRKIKEMSTDKKRIFYSIWLKSNHVSKEIKKKVAGKLLVKTCKCIKWRRRCRSMCSPLHLHLFKSLKKRWLFSWSLIGEDSLHSIPAFLTVLIDVSTHDIVYLNPQFCLAHLFFLAKIWTFPQSPLFSCSSRPDQKEEL